MRLADFILDNIEPILTEWDDFAQSIWPGNATVEPRILRDDAAEVLRAAAVDMTSAQTPTQQADKSKGVFRGSSGSSSKARMDRASTSHGRDRHGSGFDLPAVISEYRALRASVVRRWRESKPNPDADDLQDLTRFHESIDQSLGEAVIEFTAMVARERQGATDKQNELSAELREINEALLVSNVREQELAEQIAGESQRKDEFLAMLSHELRNPLAPIRSAVYLLRTQERAAGVIENPVQKQAHEIIERQVGNLTKLVSDLLEVSRVVTGRIHLNLQIVDINQVVQHAIETVAPLVEQRKHALTLNLSPEPVWCDADATRVEEVFVNLLNNAAKYTPDGGKIEIWCEQPSGANYAQVRIRDNGTGIDKELLPRIFDLFTQADRSLARSAGGLGIGLSLAHRIVALHGGSIEAYSEGPGHGAEFIVKLALSASPPPPRAEPGNDKSQAHTQLHPQGVTVLVVDDNIDLVLMLASSLRQRGYSVQSAYNGTDGLTIAQQWRPDVVLLDIGLPGLDGYEVTRRLRSDPEFAPPAPVPGGGNNGGNQMRIIALTGYGRDVDLARAQEAGFDAHMVKPYEFDELEKLMIPERSTSK